VVSEPNETQLRLLHRTIKTVTQDIEKLSFNTAISRMMEFTNEMGQSKSRPRKVLEPFVQLLSPFAPHLSEELWSLLGHEETIAYSGWPSWDDSKIAESSVEVPVQINGKLKGKITVPSDTDKQELVRIAMELEAVSSQLEGKTLTKTIVVVGRMVNFVVE
jgi:leucyl-tRNA synthetase